MANPTTNYGFVLPTSTDLVTDLPADFDVALQGVDTRMKALEPATTLGDLQYRSATANTNTRLPIGSNGNVLSVVGGVPAWTAPAAGGKVLQVVYASYATATSNTSGSTYIDTGLTATITPTLATSKILAIFNHQSIFRNSASDQMLMKFYRGATQIYETSLLYLPISIGAGMEGTCTLVIQDEPATTSATTYKTQFRPSIGGQTVTVQSSNFPSSLTLMEIGV